MSIRRPQVIVRPEGSAFRFGRIDPVPVEAATGYDRLVVEPISSRHIGLAHNVAAQIAALLGDKKGSARATPENATVAGRA